MLQLHLTDFLYGPDQQFAALQAGEAKRFADHISGPQCTAIFKRRTYAEQRRLKNTAK